MRERTQYQHLTEIENALENVRCRYLVERGWRLDNNNPGSIITYRKTINGVLYACSPKTAVELERAAERSWQN